jgi:hypothetical protein
VTFKLRLNAAAKKLLKPKLLVFDEVRHLVH